MVIHWDNGRIIQSNRGNVNWYDRRWKWPVVDVQATGSGFFFLSLSGIVLYASSVGSGNALWSRTLVGATLLGGLFTLNPFGQTTALWSLIYSVLMLES